MNTRERGFTLLLAALVASTVLSIGAAVYSIAFKQVQLSAIGRDSQFAFYAADTAAECALFWDFRTDLNSGNSFASSSSSNASNSLQQVTCDGETVTIYTTESSASASTSTFYYAPSFDSTHGHCAEVTVAKYLNPSTQGMNTTIHADGYSTVVTGTPAQQASACTPATVSGDPPPLPTAVNSDDSAIQRTVQLRY